MEREVIWPDKFDGHAEGDVTLPAETLTVIHNERGEIELRKIGDGQPDMKGKGSMPEVSFRWALSEALDAIDAVEEAALREMRAGVMKPECFHPLMARLNAIWEDLYETSYEQHTYDGGGWVD